MWRISVNDDDDGKKDESCLKRQKRYVGDWINGKAYLMYMNCTGKLKVEASQVRSKILFHSSNAKEMKRNAYLLWHYNIPIYEDAQRM